MLLLPERRRLLDKLIREIGRSETQAIDHPARETRRMGDVPPVLALQEVANHATAMRVRFDKVLRANEIPIPRSGLGATLASLRHLVVDRVVDAERSFRTSLLDLRYGLEVVKLLREVSRGEELFGVIRWCDDWLGARRPLLARVEAQLAWFAQHPGVALMSTPPAAEPIQQKDAVEPLETSTSPEHGDDRPTFRDRS